MAKPPAPMPLDEHDYEAIEAAVMETNRGRWFLAEYARRNKSADTTVLLAALERIEAMIRGERQVETVDRIRFDLIEMSKAIARTKAEIATIKPASEHHGKFGEASEELDSIVLATEAATSDILAAAEQIQEIAWTLREQGLDGEICDLVDAKATDIYTACSFQDLTGQRSRKVIQVLRYLEGRINAMIDIWGLDSAMAAEAAEAAKVRHGEQALVRHGAQNSELDQEDIDMVMGPGSPGERERARTPAADGGRPRGVEILPPKAAPAAARSRAHPAAETRAPRQAPPPVAKQASRALPPPKAAPASRREPPLLEAPATPAHDPLAPILALSPEERIALFS